MKLSDLLKVERAKYATAAAEGLTLIVVDKDSAVESRFVEFTDSDSGEIIKGTSFVQDVGLLSAKGLNVTQWRLGFVRGEEGQVKAPDALSAGVYLLTPGYTLGSEQAIRPARSRLERVGDF